MIAECAGVTLVSFASPSQLRIAGIAPEDSTDCAKWGTRGRGAGVGRVSVPDAVG